VRVSKLSIADCSASLSQFHEPVRAPLGAAAFAAKLHVFTPELSEGFFGQKVILVEGSSDKALLEARFKVLGRTATSEGLTVLSVGGKKSLDKPIHIFKTLGIPTYAIFDNDRESGNDEQAEIRYNRFLQKVLGTPADQVTDWPDGVFDGWAAWSYNLEKYIITACGQELYERVKTQMKVDFEVESEDCVKSPVIAAAMLTSFIANGIEFPELDEIIRKIDAL
jgi:hypothetical protein